MVYPKKQTGTTAAVQEAITLDADFGFFVGAYLAEGCCCSSDGRPASDDYHHHVMISNVDPAYQDRVKRLCDAWGCGWHMDERKDDKGHTATVRIHSVVLATLMTRACGNGAANKRLPAELLAADEAFLLGLLDGYFSGPDAYYQELAYLPARETLADEGVSDVAVPTSTLTPVDTGTIDNNAVTSNIQYRDVVLDRFGNPAIADTITAPLPVDPGTGRPFPRLQLDALLQFAGNAAEFSG
jgi:hypothetical protein